MKWLLCERNRGLRREYVLKWLMWGMRTSLLQARMRSDWTRCLSTTMQESCWGGYLSQAGRKQDEKGNQGIHQRNALKDNME